MMNGIFSSLTERAKNAKDLFSLDKLRDEIIEDVENTPAVEISEISETADYVCADSEKSDCVKAASILSEEEVINLTCF